jgi:hypothetical protein
MSEFTFQVHHNFPRSVLERYGREITQLFPGADHHPFHPDARGNLTPLFTDPAIASLWSAAHGGAGANAPVLFGNNSHPNGGNHPELRTPLNGVIGKPERLSEDAMPTESRKAA